MSCYGIAKKNKHEKNYEVGQVTEGIAYGPCDQGHLQIQARSDAISAAMQVNENVYGRARPLVGSEMTSVTAV